MSYTETPPSDREAVLAIFESHRATPGAPFDEAHFLDYLLAQPKSKGAVHNSFTGLRRYNAFINAVQLHFSICFAVHDFESTYSLQKFVDRVGELKRSKRASMASLRNQQQRGFGWGAVFIANFLALVVFAGALRHSPTLAVSVAVPWSLFNVAVATFYLRWRAYLNRLLGQLQKNGGE